MSDQLTYGRFHEVPLRPLSKGMFTDIPANGIPSGGFSSIKNFRVHEGFLETRGGFTGVYRGEVPIDNGDLITYEFGNLREKIQDVVYHWKTNKQSETLVLTDRFLYDHKDAENLIKIVALSGPFEVENDTQTGTSVVFEIADLEGFENNREGDYILNYSTGVLIGRINSIEAGSYKADLIPGYTWVGDDITIIHCFRVVPGYTVDYTILGGYGTTEAGNEMILTDQADRGVYIYTEGNLEIYPIDSSPLGDGGANILGSAKCVTYFDDRLWLGNITETDGSTYPQRIWWSDALDYDRFNPANYMDLPYSRGELLKIKPLGPNLILYFVDTIYIGRPTQIVGRPYEFQEINTNGIGLVAQKALTTFDDGHFFVGQDDIYYLSQSGGLQRIGTPVRSVTVEATNNLQLAKYIQACSDPTTESVAFLFPDVPQDMIEAQGLATKLWRFYYKPQAWAYDEIPIENDLPQAYYSSISLARTVTKALTYQDWYELDGPSGDPAVRTTDYTVEWLGDRGLNAVYSDDETVTGTPPSEQLRWSNYGSYEDLSAFTVSEPRLFIGLYYMGTAGLLTQAIVFESQSADLDTIGADTYEITYELVSPDFDFGVPDKDKLVRQVSFRMMEHVDSYFLPNFWVTDGKARRNPISTQQELWYQRSSPVRYFTNYNEGKTSFLIRGSIFKFKMSFNRVNERYRISEFVIHLKVEGTQIDI